jgi:death-on-curing protein
VKPSLTLPPIEAVIDLHGELLAEHGGAPGLRDRGALEAAMARPHQLLAYAEGPVTVFDLAAAVCVSICRTHPFVDGNKRAGFMVLGLILGMNGLFLDVSEHEAAETIQALASGQLGEETFRDWVSRNSFEE